jgi:hopanoid-associated phosphorylase
VTRLGIITGMATEAARVAKAADELPENARPLVAAVGGDARKAEEAARKFAHDGVVGLVSFGIAGGLDPSLNPGDIVIADAISGPDDTVTPASAAWRDSVAAGIGAARRVVVGPVAGSDGAVSTAQAKAALRARTGAVAVDMESHGVALAAAGLPVLAVRAIADPASRSIPAAALAGIGADGRRRPLAVLIRLLKAPTEIPALIRIARDSSAALGSLSVAAPALLQASVAYTKGHYQ